MKHTVTNLTTGAITIEDLPPGVDPHEWMAQRMDDCPLCKEARARGEVPLLADPAVLQEINDRGARRRRLSMRRPRWRALKRNVR